MAVGYGIRTTDGVIGTSGSAKDIYGINVVDDGTATTVKFYDGTTASGTLVQQITTTAGVPLSLTLGGTQGVRFKSGCFVDVDTHTVLATVYYQEVV